MIDPRIISAAALVVIGLVLCGFVVRVWLTHPVNRVFLVGKFVTGEGLRLLLTHLPAVFAAGLFAISAAMARFAYTARWKGEGFGATADFFGTIEAVFAVWAACCVSIMVVRLCRQG